MVARITVAWELFRHDGTGVVIGQEPYKPVAKYTKTRRNTRGKICILTVTDDLSISGDEMTNFCRALMDGQLIPKKVGMEN